MNLFAKRPRHFHAGPDDDASGSSSSNSKKAKTSDNPLPYLYKNALESIFVFLDLGELATVLAVDRAWNRAVSSTRSISSSWVCPNNSALPVVDICASPLARHIGSLRVDESTSPESIYLMHLSMPHLRELSCQLSTKINGAIHFPRDLCTLSLRVKPLTAMGDIKKLILAASRLSGLESFTFHGPTQDSMDLLDLSPFAATTSLRSIHTDQRRTRAYTPAQLAQLRAIPRLEKIEKPLVMKEVRVLLKTPHQLQLTSLRIDDSVKGVLELLATVSTTLTSLHFANVESMSFAFLRSVPYIRSLQLSGGSLGTEASETETEKLLDGCTWPLLTSMKLYDVENLTSAHISCLVSRMPALTNLELSGLESLESLECLATHGSTLSQSLTQLDIRECSLLGANDLQYVATLKQLEFLTLSGAFVASLDGWTRIQLNVPSLVLPNLVESGLYDN